MIVGGLVGRSSQQAERAGGGVGLNLKCHVCRSVVAQCAAALHVMVVVHEAAELCIGVGDESTPIARPEVKGGR